MDGQAMAGAQGDRYSGQIGVAVLYAPISRETRVNPTVGLGVRF